jgi:serine/threonine protein kinase
MGTLAPGAVIGGRYKIQRLIGEGATGAVYLARDTRDRGSTWAIKELWAEGDPEAADIFRNEIRVLRALRHPAIPTLEDAFDVGERRYLVMERVEGPTLERVLDEAGRPLDEAEVLGWGIQLCGVLEYLHGRIPPIIYRDLKPANCMLTRGDRIRIVDLGIARRFNPSRPRDTHVFGTPGYCAPEQYHGRSLEASDIYALGATLYVLLTRAEAETFHFAFPPLRRLNRAVSAGTEETLARALEADPGARWTSAGQMREALEACRREAGRGRWWGSRRLR